MQSRLQGIPAGLHNLFDLRIGRDGEFGKVADDVAPVGAWKALDRHQCGTRPQCQLGRQAGHGRQEPPELADHHGAFARLEVQVDEHAHLAPLLEVADGAEHGPFLRHDLLAQRGTPRIEEGAEQGVLQILGDDREVPEVSAGDLAEPLEVPGMEAEVEGWLSGGSVGGHRVESLGRDDGIESLPGKIRRPEQLQGRPGKDSVRFPAQGHEFPLRKAVAESAP